MVKKPKIDYTKIRDEFMAQLNEAGKRYPTSRVHIVPVRYIFKGG